MRLRTAGKHQVLERLMRKGPERRWAQCTRSMDVDTVIQREQDMPLFTQGGNALFYRLLEGPLEEPEMRVHFWLSMAEQTCF